MKTVCIKYEIMAYGIEAYHTDQHTSYMDNLTDMLHCCY